MFANCKAHGMYASGVCSKCLADARTDAGLTRSEPETMLEQAAKQIAATNALLLEMQQQLAESYVAHQAALRENEATRKKLAEAEALIAKIAEQRPEKPDYWSSCSQCKHNISDAEDFIECNNEALAAVAGKDFKTLC